MVKTAAWTAALIILMSPLACQKQEEVLVEETTDVQMRLAKYTPFRLTTDLAGLTEKQRQMIPLLMDAAREMDDLFWIQAYGDKEKLLSSTSDADLRRLLEINYGPWDRLAGNEPFMEGAGAKPKGANFYPADMSKEEFEKALSAAEDGGAQLKSLYTMVRRNSEGDLVAQPYHQLFAPQLQSVAAKLRAAAGLAEDEGLKNYLLKRAEALLTGEYQASDMAWMEMKNNIIDVVIGPIETYEDRLYGSKAAFEAFVLVKDAEWSRRLSKYKSLLPRLQQELPVPDQYKREVPGSESDLNAYDAIYYAGDCNSGAKTIAINLPNDEEVQIKKGARRLQLKNAMRAKFDKILMPIAAELIAEDQRRHISFDAFFTNTMFHEVAHGLGIKRTITSKGTVREALQEETSGLEEGKADILGLYMVGKLTEWGELPEENLHNHYVTFLASIFRSIRFGTTSAHGVANLVRFGYFKKMEAFTRDPSSGTYRVNFEKMPEAVDSLTEKILRLQGDGDYPGTVAFRQENSGGDPQLEQDLQRLAEAGIPVDIIFEQGS